LLRDTSTKGEVQESPWRVQLQNEPKATGLQKEVHRAFTASSVVQLQYEIEIATLRSQVPELVVAALSSCSVVQLNKQGVEKVGMDNLCVVVFDLGESCLLTSK